MRSNKKILDLDIYEALLNSENDFTFDVTDKFKIKNFSTRKKFRIKNSVDTEDDLKRIRKILQ